MAFADSSTDEYRSGAPVVQIPGGLGVSIVKFLSAVVEFKLSDADIEAELEGGGTLQFEPLTHRLLLGISVNFGRKNTWTR